jgi:hypothetical protein
LGTPGWLAEQALSTEISSKTENMGNLPLGMNKVGLWNS